MTDLSLHPARVVHRAAGSAAASRLEKRHRAERRFKLLGAGALLLTAVFVVTILFDIAIKGWPAFFQHSLTVEIAVPADAIDPAGTRDPNTIRSADYYTISRDAMFAAIPGIEGRAEKKALVGLLSSGAANELRETLAQNPELLGQKVRVRLLLSDDADLYLKGSETAVSSIVAQGVATPSGSTGDIRIQASENDFAVELARVKAELAERIAQRQLDLARVKLGGESRQADAARIAAQIAEMQDRLAQRDAPEALDGNLPSLLVALNGGLVKLDRLSASEVSGRVIIPLNNANPAPAGTWSLVTYETAENDRKIRDIEVAFLERLRAEGQIERHFNTLFFTAGDSREAELAGILGSLVGSVLMLFVTIVLCVPIGVLAAVYLEEFAPKNRLTDLIEININNLAAVPSIVFGLLGLAVFLNFFGLPRSAPLVGGLVLALLVLPTIIIAARAALRAVPPSIKEAALGIGASHQQAVFHHVLPLAMPGIMTGTIIGMAHALGETAPLLMIGMLAFIADIPSGFTDAATALPAQIYIWSDLPEMAFQAKTAAAIIVLLGLLFFMNGTAIWLRKKFERRW